VYKCACTNAYDVLIVAKNDSMHICMCTCQKDYTIKGGINPKKNPRRIELLGPTTLFIIEESIATSIGVAPL
jgi:hypothetical protein